MKTAQGATDGDKQMQLNQQIIAAAKEFNADDFGVQYYDRDENGYCTGEPDCLSIDDDGVLTFHPQGWPFCGEIQASGQDAVDLYRKAIDA